MLSTPSVVLLPLAVSEKCLPKSPADNAFSKENVTHQKKSSPEASTMIQWIVKASTVKIQKETNT